MQIFKHPAIIKDRGRDGEQRDRKKELIPLRFRSGVGDSRPGSGGQTGAGLISHANNILSGTCSINRTIKWLPAKAGEIRQAATEPPQFFRQGAIQAAPRSVSYNSSARDPYLFPVDAVTHPELSQLFAI